MQAHLGDWTCRNEKEPELWRLDGMDALALTLPLQHTFAHRKRGDRIKERTLGKRLLVTKSWEGLEEKLTKSTTFVQHWEISPWHCVRFGYKIFVAKKRHGSHQSSHTAPVAHKWRALGHCWQFSIALILALKLTSMQDHVGKKIIQSSVVFLQPLEHKRALVQ